MNGLSEKNTFWTSGLHTSDVELSKLKNRVENALFDFSAPEILSKIFEKNKNRGIHVIR